MKKSPLDPEQVRSLGRYHAEVETAGQMEETMATLVEEPIYDFFPVGLRLQGAAAVRRYYQHLFDHFLPSVKDSEVIGEWVDEHALVQEYVVHIHHEGREERHFLTGILYVEGDKLGGERIWGSEVALRRLLGPVYPELTPIP